jgi:hypothetical protein
MHNQIRGILTKSGLIPVLGNIGEIIAHDRPDNVGRVGRVPIILDGLVMQKETGSKFIQ